MSGLTAKELYDMLQKIVEKGKGSSRIFFDSEAVCFRTHLVEIEDVSFDSDEETGIGDTVTLHWSMQTQPFFHFTAKMEDKLLSPTCGEEQRKFLDLFEKEIKLNDTNSEYTGHLGMTEEFHSVLFLDEFKKRDIDLKKVLRGE